MKKAVLIMSGGMDSTVLLYHLLNQGVQVRALGVNYGQRHSKELIFAQETCEALEVPFKVADLHCLAELLPGSSQTDSSVDVPEGHYAEENMKKTVVPNRNMIMLSVAIGHAIAHDIEAVAYAAHAGDHAIYPDCRSDFAQAMGVVAQLCDWKKVQLMRPFITLSKADIAKLGHDLGVKYDSTWSCYKGGDLHCGRCGTCVERREAFYLAGVEDPTEYAPDAPTVEELVAKNWKV